ncbi:MAG: protein kinase [Thermoanaerobaculia bacterium]|nr:protein kinase [Thermoanaerobaculia bacterium]
MRRRTETETVAPEAEPPPLPAPLAAGTRIAHRYLIRRELGRGGFAVVYEALDELRGRPVALKLLRTDRLGRAARTRFEREAAVAGELSHPHLVKVHDSGSDGDLAWLAMELVDGAPLTAHAAGEPLAVGEVIRIAREALSGLAALHAAGLVHRDVKPSNLLLAADGTVKLADFGLARRFTADDPRITTTAALVGTLDYLSPEQAMGDELDGRSDLYSLGVVLFELLTGRPLHEGRSTLGTLLARLKDPVPDLSELRPEVPAWLAAWMEKLLARERDDRYASAGDALADLERERAPLRPQGHRLRRSWSLAAAALLLLVLATAGVAIARRPRFDRMLLDGPASVRAVDQRGRTLWERAGPLATRNFLPVRTAPGGTLRIAAVLAAAADHSYPASRTLSLLDPRTGAVRETEVFPSAATFGFPPELADSYGASLWARDLDGDGTDEVLVTFLHHPFYPSYTVLYEPRRRRSRLLFLASGHHLPAAAADLDGDGRAEVLLAGFANRLGWQTGLAALRIEPWVADSQAEDPALPPGETPDRASRANTDEHNALLWYALGPPGSFAFDDPERVAVDPASRRIALRLGTGERLELDFDGFPASPAPAVPLTPRRARGRPPRSLAGGAGGRAPDGGGIPRRRSRPGGPGGRRRGDRRRPPPGPLGTADRGALPCPLRAPGAERAALRGPPRGERRGRGGVRGGPRVPARRRRAPRQRLVPPRLRRRRRGRAQPEPLRDPRGAPLLPRRARRARERRARARPHRPRTARPREDRPHLSRFPPLVARARAADHRDRGPASLDAALPLLGAGVPPRGRRASGGAPGHAAGAARRGLGNRVAPALARVGAPLAARGARGSPRPGPRSHRPGYRGR